MIRFLLLLFPALAFAQTIDEPVDSIRAPFSSEVTYAGVIQLETISATTGKPVLTGTAVKLPSINLIADAALLVDLAGNKTTGVTISGVRATFTATPAVTSGWEQVAPFGIRKTFKAPIVLPAGNFLGCRYDMPAQNLSIQSAVATSWTTVVNVVSVLFGGPVQQAKMTWTAAKGNLRCSVGVKAADIPSPIVIAAPPPPAPPPPPPPPAPPPAPGASPDCTKVPPAAQLVDGLGATWASGLRDPSGTAAGQVAIFRTRPGTSTTDRIYGGAEFVQVNAGLVCASDFLSGSGWECWDAATGKMVHTDAPPPACP